MCRSICNPRKPTTEKGRKILGGELAWWTQPGTKDPVSNKVVRRDIWDCALFLCMCIITSTHENVHTITHTTYPLYVHTHHTPFILYMSLIEFCLLSGKPSPAYGSRLHWSLTFKYNILRLCSFFHGNPLNEIQWWFILYTHTPLWFICWLRNICWNPDCTQEFHCLRKERTCFELAHYKLTPHLANRAEISTLLQSQWLPVWWPRLPGKLEQHCLQLNRHQKSQRPLYPQAEFLIKVLHSSKTLFF